MPEALDTVETQSHSVGRRVATGLLLGLAIGGAFIPPAAPPPVSASRLRQGGIDVESVGDPRVVEERYRVNEPILRGMMAGGATEDDTRNVVRDLGFLPPDVIRVLRDRGIRFVPFDPFQREVRTDGLVGSPVDLNAVDPRSGYVEVPAQDLRALARSRGAQSGREAKRFEEAVRRLNPNPGERILIPDVEMERGRAWRPADAQRLRRLDDMLKSDENGGVYVDEDRVILVRRDVLPDPSMTPGRPPLVGHHRVILHEVGHAVDFALRERDRDRTMRIRRDFNAAPPEKFPDAYSHKSEFEYYAEIFEGALTRDRGDRFEGLDRNGNRAWLAAHNPDMLRQVDEDLEAFGRLAPLTRS